MLRWALVGLISTRMAAAAAAPADAGPLRLSVYATAGDVQRHLSTAAERERAVSLLARLHVTRVFLEGRRGDEYVPPRTLIEVRDHMQGQGIQVAGGIATVPGRSYGVAQNGGLGWLNWESEQTRRDVAGFFAEDAPLFPELIVDDFFCTGDLSAASVRARGERSWSQYRRDLLVSLISPLMVEPARAARPSVRLIIKFPQWYDRFEVFGYDPPRMASWFDQVWVGTEVRDPKTRRMGYVQPTQGYMNFCWLKSLTGKKALGAWFDHIECSAQNFVDQAYLSVLAGAPELTLFHLGDLVEGHPGDALLAAHWPQLTALAARIAGAAREGVACYKPPGSDGEENLFLMDYLGMIGLPILPVATYPASARSAFLGAQSASDPNVVTEVRRHLRRGATVVLTPAFVRRAGRRAAELAGVETSLVPAPATVTAAQEGERTWPLPVPLEVDGGLAAARCQVLLRAGVSSPDDRQLVPPGDRDPAREGRARSPLRAADAVNGVGSRGAHGVPRPAGNGRFTGSCSVPLLTSHRSYGGRVLVLNVRTFSAADYRGSGEWLLPPQRRGLPEIPPDLANRLREFLLGPLGLRLEAPSGVALFVIGKTAYLYNFHDRPVSVRVNDREVAVGANALAW
jgi:hypothetical protein